MPSGCFGEPLTSTGGVVRGLGIRGSGSSRTPIVAPIARRLPERRVEALTGTAVRAGRRVHASACAKRISKPAGSARVQSRRPLYRFAKVGKTACRERGYQYVSRKGGAGT